MYLAEAIKEKVFIEKSIDALCDRIRELSVSADDADVKLNKGLAKNKIKELETLHKEWQRYAITISRAKVVSKIKLNDEEFSIADAETILESMGDRLDYLEGLIIHIEAFNLTPQKFVCMDLEDLHSKANNIRADIRSIGNSVERSLWNIEV